MASSLSVNQLLDVASINGKTPDLNDGPHFYAYNAAAQSISNGVNTKINCPTEIDDSANCYDTVASRFTPNVAGYYLLVAGGHNLTYLELWKNGVAARRGLQGGGGIGGNVVDIVYLNGTTDYVEFYGFQNHTAGSANTGTSGLGHSLTFFRGMLVRSA